MVDQVRNRQEQAEIYGEAFDAVVRRLGSTLGLTQAQLAEVMGISAPMLSQLVTAKRVKLGNPASLRRLDALQELADGVDDGRVSAAEIPDRLGEIRQVSGHRTTSQVVQTAPAGRAEDVAAAIQHLLRDLASGADLRAAADLLEPTQPALAGFLRVYGLGSGPEASEHYRAHAHH